MKKDIADKLRELAAEQAAQQKIVDDGLAAARALADDGDAIPDADKDRVRAASAEVIRIGEQIASFEAEEKKRIENNAEFFRTMGGAGDGGTTGQVMDTLQVRDPNDPEDPLSGEATITRETVAVARELLRARYGSGAGGPRPVNQESERLCLTMLRATPEERRVKGHAWSQQARQFQRTQLIGADATGGYLVPDDNTFTREVQFSDGAFGGAKMLAREIVTADGRPLPIPTSDALLGSGESKAEGAAVTDVTINFGQDRMRAFVHSSGRLGCSFEAREDAGVNLPMILGMVAGVMINRIEAQRLVSGTGGANQPEGLITGYTLNPQRMYTEGGVPNWRASDSATEKPNWVELLNAFKRSVDPFYRSSNKFSMLLHDQVEGAFAGSTDSDNRALFMQWLLGSTAKGMGMTFAGMNILCDYSLPALHGDATVAATQAGGFIGDFNWFWLRRVGGLRMIEDPYSSANEFVTHWVFVRRMDSRCLFKANPAGTTPAIVPIHVANRA